MSEGVTDPKNPEKQTLLIRDPFFPSVCQAQTGSWNDEAHAKNPIVEFENICSSRHLLDICVKML